MVRRSIGAAVVATSLGMAGAAGAQGFSAGGSAGVAQSRGLTASPGVHGVTAGADAGRVVEPRALYGGARETDIDFPPRSPLGAGAPLPRQR